MTHQMPKHRLNMFGLFLPSLCCFCRLSRHSLCLHPSILRLLINFFERPTIPGLQQNRAILK